MYDGFGLNFDLNNGHLLVGAKFSYLHGKVYAFPKFDTTICPTSSSDVKKFQNDIGNIDKAQVLDPFVGSVDSTQNENKYSSSTKALFGKR